MGSKRRIFSAPQCVLAVQGHSRSSKVDDFGTNRKRVCHFLLVINSNYGPILHRFRDTATYWLKIAPDLRVGCGGDTPHHTLPLEALVDSISAPSSIKTPGYAYVVRWARQCSTYSGHVWLWPLFVLANANRKFYTHFIQFCCRIHADVYMLTGYSVTTDTVIDNKDEFWCFFSAVSVLLMPSYRV